ncbi:glycolate permease glcA domain protein [Burkholderia pseudomallei MSHR3964]|nr:glycolate permease glcA domain protein [Burkholderia pseudomallei MSHR3964]
MGPAKQRFAGPSIRRHRFSRHRRATATDSTRRATANDARRTDNKAPAPTGAPIRTAREAVAHSGSFKEGDTRAGLEPGLSAARRRRLVGARRRRADHSVLRVARGAAAQGARRGRAHARARARHRDRRLRDARRARVRIGGLRLRVRPLADRMDHRHRGVPLQDRREERPVRRDPQLDRVADRRSALADAVDRLLVRRVSRRRGGLRRAGRDHGRAARRPWLQSALCGGPVPDRGYRARRVRRARDSGDRRGAGVGPRSDGGRRDGGTPVAVPVVLFAVLARVRDGRRKGRARDVARRARRGRQLRARAVLHVELHRARVARRDLGAREPRRARVVPEGVAAVARARGRARATARVGGRRRARARRHAGGAWAARARRAAGSLRRIRSRRSRARGRRSSCSP